MMKDKLDISSNDINHPGSWVVDFLKGVLFMDDHGDTWDAIIAKCEQS